ncbi:MAG TPA: hypothetical protein VGW10_07795 [Solirubrobacteraceae bacterium]|nr:hypothetical protein [Solirubrobacteraceae bacterium]
MRRAAVLLALALTAPATASAETLHVGIPGRYFAPAELQAVVGDTVTWHNTSGEAHDVAGARVDPGEEIGRTFDQAGRVPYVCVLHPSMGGVVDVVPVLLTAPATLPTRGEPLVLSGRAPAGTPFVALERDGAPVATVPTAPDGTFRYEAPPQSGTYRAGESPPLRLDVVDRVDVGLLARYGRRFTTLRVTTTPPRPGATVVLQLWSRERFAWRRATKATLDRAGRTTLTLERRVRARARVVLLDDGGREVATSRQAFTWALSRPPRLAASPHGAQPPQHGAAHAPPAA